MPLRPILALLVAMTSIACMPADADKPIADTRDAIPPAVPTTVPPANTMATVKPTPGRHHGTWRLVAADDRHDAALMAFSLQSDDGNARGSGDFTLFQPFCDAVAGMPIVGSGECEMIGLSAEFDRVDIDQDRVLLVFHPTADGLPHRLELHVEGDALVGDYVAEANSIRRAVIARHPPSDEP